MCKCLTDSDNETDSFDIPTKSTTPPAFTRSKSAIETPKQFEKFLQS